MDHTTLHSHMTYGFFKGCSFSFQHSMIVRTCLAQWSVLQAVASHCSIRWMFELVWHNRLFCFGGFGSVTFPSLFSSHMTVQIVQFWGISNYENCQQWAFYLRYLPPGGWKGKKPCRRWEATRLVLSRRKKQRAKVRLRKERAFVARRKGSLKQRTKSGERYWKPGQRMRERLMMHVVEMLACGEQRKGEWRIATSWVRCVTDHSWMEYACYVACWGHSLVRRD